MREGADGAALGGAILLTLSDATDQLRQIRAQISQKTYEGPAILSFGFVCVCRGVCVDASEVSVRAPGSLIGDRS